MNLSEKSTFCQYVQGDCDQNKKTDRQTEAFFIYPSQPTHLARTVLECVRKLKDHSSDENYLSWEHLGVSGQIVFCEICKAITTTKVVVADITTTNFNVLFELGYAIGCGKAVLPVRDSTFERDKKLFDEIGIFNTLGYQNFTNSNELLSLVRSKKTYSPPIQTCPEPNKNQPIYYIRSPIDTDGSIKLLSCLKKSYFRFRTFDAREFTRLSLHEAYKQAMSSVAVVAHLIDPERTGASSHNARAAFVCGIALAAGKHVLMLQEDNIPQPIDYRDLVVPYGDPNSIPFHIESIVRSTADTIQQIKTSTILVPKGLLEKLDLGDVAAENEIQSLSNYFVKTPQFQQARQGHARLVIGRKGSGKTALFYGVRKHVSAQRNNIILDLKPEGHQFAKLRDYVLVKLNEGLQQHTLTAFWHYLLLIEIVHRLFLLENKNAYSNPDSLKLFKPLKELHEKHVQQGEDFSERLMSLINHLIEQFPDKTSDDITGGDITGAIYEGDIKVINEIIITHLEKYGNLWILFDNIDKGFPPHGLKKEDVLVVRCLLEATRKLQRNLNRHGIDCLSTIFIRRDVFEHLINNTPDRGKESYANLDWSDPELLKELLLRRFQYEAPELDGNFEDVWSKLFDPHVAGESSFRYILNRTFLRPRDILNFTRKCIQVAVSRGRHRVEPDDIKTAEKGHSDDMLNELRYEIRDVFPDYPDLVLAFIGISDRLSSEDIDLVVMEAGLSGYDIEKLIDILLWFSFLGIAKNDDEFYAYDLQYNMPKLISMKKKAKPSDSIFVIHPAFRSALNT